MKKVEIQELIGSLRKKTEDTLHIDRLKAVGNAAAVGMSDIRDLAVWDAENGVRFKDSAEIPDHAALAIMSIKQVEKVLQDDRDTGDTILQRTMEIKLHPKVAGLDRLSKLLGWDAVPQSGLEQGDEDDSPTVGAVVMPPVLTEEEAKKQMTVIDQEVSE